MADTRRFPHRSRSCRTRSRSCAFSLIPVFVVLVLRTDGEGSYGLAALFAAAALTDQVDGYLARRWHVESEFGKFADPLADRLMIDAAVAAPLARRPPALARARDRPRPRRDPVGRLRLRQGPRLRLLGLDVLGKAATWVLYAAITGVHRLRRRDGLAALALLDRHRAGRAGRGLLRRGRVRGRWSGEGASSWPAARARACVR